MKQNIVTSDGVITNLTMAKESNSLIMRKGRSSLLASKVMLLALLKIEDRDNISYSLQEKQYYAQLEKETHVDYSKGIVSEIHMKDLKKIFNKKSSGSFYTSIRTLFESDPHEERSLRNSFAVMLPDEESGATGYAEIVVGCHFSSDGRLLIKFSSEKYIRSQLMQLRSNYTELPLLICASLKSIYSLRLLEILSSAIQSTDNSLRSMGQDEVFDYSFRYTLGEIQMMFGVIDITLDSKGKQMISMQNPDYNHIARDVNSRLNEHMGIYSYFRRYALSTAIDEINSIPEIGFTVTYEAERINDQKVTHIVFYVKKKHGPTYKDPIDVIAQESKGDVILAIADVLRSYSLTFNQLEQIAEAADYNKDTIVAAYNLYEQMKLTQDFTQWFLDLRK